MSSEEDFVPIPDEDEEYVPAVFAKSQKEAEMYQQLLLDHDIESVIGYENEDAPEDSDEERSPGLPVLVLESYLDEASEVIADREDQDEFEDDDYESNDDEEEDEYEDFSPESEEEIDEDDEEYGKGGDMDFLDDLDDDMEYEDDDYDDIDDNL